MNNKFKIFSLFFSIFALFFFSFYNIFLKDITNDVDELGLWNPIYMYLNYGKMTYPVHYYPDAMFVHPPIRYLEVAWLMKFGMPAFFARGFSFFFMIVIIAYAIIKSPLHIHWRIAFIFAVIWTFVYFNQINSLSIRPDWPLAAAFIAGLLFLENGRQKKWNSTWLFVGSFLFTYACSLHYFAWPGLLGILAYFYASYKEQNLRQMKSSWCSIILGGALFGVLYLFLFVIPNFSDINYLASFTLIDRNFFYGVIRHYNQYIYALKSFNWQNTSIATIIQSFYFLKVPVFIIAGLILFKSKNSHYLFICALPLCAFVWFFSFGKSIGYYIIETFLLLFAILLALGKSIDLFFSFFHFKASKNLATLGIIIVGLFFGLQPANKYFDNSKNINNYNILETDIARASARDIIGFDALVAGRIPAWFISGGKQWYDLTQDLHWNKDRPIDQQKFVALFDAIVETSHMSNQTNDITFGTPNNWYLEKFLNLKGFFFGSSHPHVSFPIYSEKLATPIKGYIWNGNQLSRFDQTLIGDMLFITMSCAYNNNLSFDLKSKSYYFLYMFLPEADEPGSNIAMKVKSHPQQAIVFSLWNEKEWQKHSLEILKFCKLHESISGNLTVIDHRKFIDKSKKTDSPIEFERELIRRKILFQKPEINLGPNSSLDLQQVKSFPKSEIIFKNDELWIKPKYRRLKHKDIALIPLPKMINNPKYVSIDMSITEEEIDIIFLDKNGHLQKMQRLGSTISANYYNFFIPIYENKEIKSIGIRTTFGKNKTDIRIRSITFY
jgi:hypothetical protein